MTLRQVLGAAWLLLGVCAALSGCGSSDDSAPAGAAGASGAPGASEGGAAGASEGGAPGAAPGRAGGAGASEGGAPGEAGAAGAYAINPPPSIDVKLCDSSNGSPADCIACCYAGGFLTSTIYNDKCQCGTPSENPEVCASMAAAVCFSCCNGAGYASATFTFSDPTQCSCTGKFDESVCVASLAVSDPETACHVCCLNNGYLHADYVDTGDRSCTCES